MTPEHYRFIGEEKGPHLLILGGVHGDEVCGPSAIRRVLGEISDGTLAIKAGTVTFVPEANPEACARGVRQTEENLNRIFRKSDAPASYEARLANGLCTLADEADVLLDIHSSAAAAPTNAFIDYPSEKTEALVAALGVEFEILGWPEVYASNDAGFESYTTERYMNDSGKYGATLECGRHDDPNAVEVAYQGVRRVLSHLGIAPLPSSESRENPARRVRMTKLFARESEGDVFLGEWEHLQSVPGGTEIAKRNDGTVIRAVGDTVIIFPKSYAEVGEEWLYLGVPVE